MGCRFIRLDQPCISAAQFFSARRFSQLAGRKEVWKTTCVGSWCILHKESARTDCIAKNLKSKFPSLPFLRITKRSWLPLLHSWNWTKGIFNYHFYSLGIERRERALVVKNLCQPRCNWYDQIQQSHGDTPLIFLKTRVKCTCKIATEKFEKSLLPGQIALIPCTE